MNVTSKQMNDLVLATLKPWQQTQIVQDESSGKFVKPSHDGFSTIFVLKLNHLPEHVAISWANVFGVDTAGLQKEEIIKRLYYKIKDAQEFESLVLLACMAF